jgi:hypothetical protein
VLGPDLMDPRRYAEIKQLAAQKNAVTPAESTVSPSPKA